MGELEKEQEGVAMEVEACGSALESWEQMQETLAAATTEENKEDLEGLFSQQEAQLQNLIQQESSAREAGAHAQQEAEGAAEQIAELQARLQEAEAENLRLKEATEQVGRVSKSTETYEQMLELLHDLSGVRLTAATDSRLEFRVTTHVSSAEKTGRRKQAEVEHDLVVDLNSQTGGIEDARLNPSDVDIADIVDTVRGTRRLDFLVREIRQRMSCYALRASQVARTNRTTKYKMKTNKNDMIQVALPATGIMAFIDAPYDWPTPGVVLQLETLVTRSGGAAFQDDVLEKVVEQVNKSSAAQDGELVPFLQSIEVALQQFELVSDVLSTGALDCSKHDGQV